MIFKIEMSENKTDYKMVKLFSKLTSEFKSNSYQNKILSKMFLQLLFYFLSIQSNFKQKVEKNFILFENIPSSLKRKFPPL